MLTIKGAAEASLKVNGYERRVILRPRDTLLDVLRTCLGLTGAKPGCENGDCGACTVILDGKPQKSCLVLAAEAVGHEIITVEGLQNVPEQRAFIEKHAFQCGYCTSGFLMVLHAFKARCPSPSDAELDEWLESNICRCTSYKELGDAAREIVGQLV